VGFLNTRKEERKFDGAIDERSDQIEWWLVSSPASRCDSGALKPFRWTAAG